MTAGALGALGTDLLTRMLMTPATCSGAGIAIDILVAAPVNLSILKNGRARAIRFTTLAGLCAELRCQPGDLLAYQPQPAPPTGRVLDDGIG